LYVRATEGLLIFFFSPMASSQRVVALVDLDCFYCAVERRRDPSLLGLPMAVVQYNPWENAPGGPCVVGGVTSRTPEEDRRDPLSNGSLIAVSYEARACGVKRIMRGQEARRCCPELVLVQVPTAHGKASLTIYKEAGHEVVDVMCREAGVVVEKASVDEMYLDVTAAAALLLASTSWAALLAQAAESHVAGHGGEVTASCPPSAPPSRAASAAPSPLKPAVATGSGGAAVPMAAADLALLPREAVRNGHAGQRSEAVPEVGRAWWRRAEATWCSEERALAAGAVVVARLRAAVATSLPGFTCSAGVAANKMMAKLCAGLHKPDQQTVLPAEALPALLHPLPLDRIKSLGAMFGERVMTELGVRTVGELAALIPTLALTLAPTLTQTLNLALALTLTLTLTRWASWRRCRGSDSRSASGRRPARGWRRWQWGAMTSRCSSARCPNRWAAARTSATIATGAASTSPPRGCAASRRPAAPRRAVSQRRAAPAPRPRRAPPPPLP